MWETPNYEGTRFKKNICPSDGTQAPCFDLVIQEAQRV